MCYALFLEGTYAKDTLVDWLCTVSDPILARPLGAHYQVTYTVAAF